MKSWLLLLVLSIGSLCAVGQAAWVPIASATMNQPPQVNISAVSGGWDLHVIVPGVIAANGSDVNSYFDQITLAGDAPAETLPVIQQILALSSGGNPELEVISEDWMTLEGDYRLDTGESTLTATDAFYPATPFTVSPRQVMGGVPLAAITMHTVKYNPLQRRVQVLRSATVRLRETGAPEGLSHAITESMAEILRPIVSNWNDMALDDDVVRGTYLYILAKDTLAQNGIQELIKWRKRKGHSVETAGPTQIGSWTTANIKNYIQNRYNSANPPLEFVCLVGDGDGTYQIPAFTYTLEGSNGVGDVNYTYLDGSDLLPDVNIGRLCFLASSDLRIITNRILRYERTPSETTGGTKPNWYKGGGAFAGSAQSGISTVQTMRTVYSRMVNGGYPSTSIDTVYYNNQSVGATEINASINSGTSLWCYRGYIGMSGYSNSDVANLTNVGRWPFMLNLTCSTNDFADNGYDQCEAFLAAGTPANPTGPIAICGMSSSHTNTRYNNALMDGAVQGMLIEGVHTTGGALTRGKLEIYRSYQADSAAGRLLFFMGITTLLGDPATDVFTDTPDTLVVNNPASMPIGSNTLNLTVTDIHSLPVADAYVNLVKGTEVFKGGWTDASGHITLNFATTSAETLFVTASKHNCRPAINYTLVASPTQYVAPANQNFAAVVPSQVAQMVIPLKNYGASPATNVQAVLSGSDPFITAISHTMVVYGTIAGGGTVTPSDHFDFIVASYAPSGHVVQFTLTVTDDAAHTWTSAVPVTILNGRFTFNSLTIANAGNGILDPGETGQMSLSLQNAGTRAISAGRVGYLRALSPVVTVTDSIGTFAAAAVNAACDNTADRFGLTATTNAFPGESVPFRVVFPMSGGFADTVYFNLTIGTVASTSPTPPDAYGYWAFDNTDTGYDKHPDFNWVEIDPRSPYNGPGTVVPIVDNADEQDMTTAISLPFSFTYYGESFNDISICSNGWIAMGADQTLHTDFRNYSIPSALGPRRMITPFWDDLHVMPGNTTTTPLQGADACPATVIPSIPFVCNGTTAGYANNYAGTCVGDGASDVIYQFTPTATASYVVSLCGSGYDTGLIIQTGGSCPGTTAVACNDDNRTACGDNTSQIITTLTAGVTYYIIVDGWSGSAGNYNLRVDLASAPPADPAGVYTYYDAVNHRFIIEWSRVTKYGGQNPEETFQVILKQPGYPTTPTGDGEILFQYLTCNNVEDVSTSNNFATVGIENLDKADGVLYSYWNEISPFIPGAATMTNNRAILFTTQKILPTTPRAPANLTAYSNGTTVTLIWRAVHEDVAGSPIAVTGYDVYGGNSPSFVQDGASLLGSTADTTFARTIAQDGAKFFYVVKARTGSSQTSSEENSPNRIIPESASDR